MASRECGQFADDFAMQDLKKTTERIE